MSGCGKTEYIIQTKEVAAIPPAYLYLVETKPTVPADVAVDERTDYLLEAYASRGDVIERSNRRAELMQRWVELIKKLYPDSVEKPLEDLEADADAPEGADE